jgi:molybdopterin-guanine dinucleotide biosynthesis protein A
LSASDATPLRWFSGAVLAGGLSGRMGQDKALTVIPGTRITMLDAVLGTITSVADDVMIVAPPREGYARQGVRLIPDAPGPPGPLRGIAAALAAGRHEHCVVLACDLPFANPELLRWMTMFVHGVDAVVPVIAGTSRQGGKVVFQTLHAIYHRSCLPVIERQLEMGDGRTTAFFDEIRIKLVGEEHLRVVDPQLRSFTNVNTPAEWSLEKSSDAQRVSDFRNGVSPKLYSC